MTKRKNNKQKKGFTLIELLAVIVILAILALIAIPIVISIIRDSRENANKRSIQAYGRAVENAIATWQSKNDGEAPNSISAYKIEMSGEKVECEDEIKGIDSDEGIELTKCKVVDSNGNSKSKDTYTYKGGKVIKTGEGESNNQQSYQAYSVGEGITVAGEQYYIIADSDSSQDYVTALKANPLTVEEVNTYGGVGTNNNHVNRYAFGNTGAADDHNGYGNIAYYSSLSCGYNDCEFMSTGYVCRENNFSACTNDYADSEVINVVEAWSQAKFTNDELKTVNGYGARLINFDEITTNLGYEWGQINPSTEGWISSSNTPGWVYNNNYSYWTMSPYNDSDLNVWGVGSDGSLGYSTVASSSLVIRPVINVYKSKISS